MRISSKFSVAFLGAAMLAVSSAGAFAFDPKAFEASKPNAGQIFKYFFDAREKGDQKEAVSALEYAADQGNRAALWKLGRMYQTGDGVAKDPAAAMRFYSRIVEDYGNALPGTAEWQFTSDAMVALGYYHLRGAPEAGIEPDPNKARVMLTTAATYFRNADAQFALARLYLEGDVDAVETIQAARMLKSAAAAGHVGAEALLGHLFFEGKYLRREPVRGLAMLMDAKARASEGDLAWISALHEEALSLATEEERIAAIARSQELAAAKVSN